MHVCDMIGVHRCVMSDDKHMSAVTSIEDRTFQSVDLLATAEEDPQIATSCPQLKWLLCFYIFKFPSIIHVHICMHNTLPYACRCKINVIRILQLWSRSARTHAPLCYDPTFFFLSLTVSFLAALGHLANSWDTGNSNDPPPVTNDMQKNIFT